MKAASLLTLMAASSFGASAMTLNSSDIQEGSRMAETFVFKGMGCNGENQSPQLTWSGAPAGTRSFAITAHDPDALTGSGWWHWVAVDIPATQHTLARGASGHINGAREMSNDYGFVGYGGACPPKGDGMHRYEFTVWALPTEKLELPEKASNALVGFMLNNSALAKTTLTATYVNE